MDRESSPKAKLFLETPAFEGAQVAYSWRQLEQGKDNYDFGLIREDLAFMNLHGKKLWIRDGIYLAIKDERARKVRSQVRDWLRRIKVRS